MMKKFPLPKAQDLYSQKFLYRPKPEPVWDYLEREMREKAAQKNGKPYNPKVAKFLNYLKELKRWQHNEAKRKERIIMKEIGPSWYAELSDDQKGALQHLKADIQADLIEDLPRRTRSCLSDLGCTLKFSKYKLMKAMRESSLDPGVFIWNLYNEYYKMPPSELRESYDLDAKILMSSLVYIDMAECIDALANLTKMKQKKLPPKKQKPEPSPPKPAVHALLQKSAKIPLYSNNPAEDRFSKKGPRKAPPMEYKVKLRSDESYEKLTQNKSFIELRKARNKRADDTDSSVLYKFWEPPSTFRNTDPNMTAIVEVLKMLKLRPTAKFKAPYENVQYQIGNVAFAGGKPRYLLNGVGFLTSGYTPINGGLMHVRGEMVMQICGYWKYPRDIRNSCDSECDCLEKWGDIATKYLQQTKCRCGHRYDLYHVGKAKEKYFHPSTRYGKFWIDKAKIFQMDPDDDFVKDNINEALLSKDVTPESSEPSIAPAGLKEIALLQAFLLELNDTPLIIPHLPEANLLNSLQEWVRNRVKGPLSAAYKKNLLIKSQRRWLDLKRRPCKAPPGHVPFSVKQLDNMTWDHRNLIRKLSKLLLDDFVDRNRANILQQTQLWWSTMKQDVDPTKGFSDIFFSYMPARKKDIYLFNTYCPELVRRYGAKTCPLKY